MSILLQSRLCTCDPDVSLVLTITANRFQVKLLSRSNRSRMFVQSIPQKILSRLRLFSKYLSLHFCNLFCKSIENSINGHLY